MGNADLADRRHGEGYVNETSLLFPELVETIHEPSPNPCGYPYFLLAYWPRGRYWSIKEPLAFDDTLYPGVRASIKGLHDAGWTNITILRLPSGAHPWNAP